MSIAPPDMKWEPLGLTAESLTASLTQPVTLSVQTQLLPLPLSG